MRRETNLGKVTNMGYEFVTTGCLSAVYQKQ